MQRVGSDASGFSVDLDAGLKRVRVSGWGFWNAEVAGAFADAVSHACRTTIGVTHLVLDMSRLSPLRDEGQAAVGALLGALSELGVKQVSVSTGIQLTKLQLLRITRGSAPKGLVEFVSATDGAGKV